MSTADLELKIIRLQHGLERAQADLALSEQRMASMWCAVQSAEEGIGRVAALHGGPAVDRVQDAMREAVAAYSRTDFKRDPERWPFADGAARSKLPEAP